MAETKGQQVIAELHGFVEELDYEESERRALGYITKAEAATKTAMTLHGRYSEALRSLQKLPPMMALGTLEALKDMATRCAEAVKSASTAWESAEKESGITARVKGQYERVREQYYFSGGEYLMREHAPKGAKIPSLEEQRKLMALGIGQAPAGMLEEAFRGGWGTFGLSQDYRKLSPAKQAGALAVLSSKLKTLATKAEDEEQLGQVLDDLVGCAEAMGLSGSPWNDLEEDMVNLRHYREQARQILQRLPGLAHKAVEIGQKVHGVAAPAALDPNYDWAQVLRGESVEAPITEALAGTVEVFNTILTSKITQYDQRQSMKDPNPYRLGHLLGAAHEVSKAMHGDEKKDDPATLKKLKAVISREFLPNFPPSENVKKQIDAFLANGTLPKLK